MKNVLLLFVTFLSWQFCFGQYYNPKIGDTIHAIHYDIHLEDINTNQQKIKAFTQIQLTSKIENLDYIPLELKDLTVDSVAVDGINHEFTHFSEIIRISLAEAISPADTLIVNVFYQGKPFSEGWGGYHFSGDYSFNLGVGFESIPHNLGKTWFPCVDDFTDRATYDFFVTVDDELTAICGGMLQGVSQNPDNTKTWHWKLDAPVPTYLASVATGNYLLYFDEFVGMEDTIPITIYTRPSEIEKVEGSFVNLKAVLQWFEEHFGPYPFGRVGYTGTAIGAMEHATNIAYPNNSINGNTASESLYVHELSHMWFGDMVTCSSAEDMWMNEGWATFCELYYLNDLYSYEDYRTLFRYEHREVLRKAHIIDGGYFALNAIPQEVTYGKHAYEKGGVVANALRGYMGDPLFFDAMTAYLDNFAFQSVSSEDMRDFLTDYTGIDMAGFFDAWVFTPGSPHFSIDSTKVIPNQAGYQVDIWFKQKFKAADFLAQDVVSEITFVDDQFNEFTDTVHFSGKTGHSVKQLDVEPVAVFLDLYEKTCDATTDNFKIFTGPTEFSFPVTYFKIFIDQLDDVAFVRTTHNWVAPDSLKLPIDGLKLSNYHYWKIEGVLPEDYQARGSFVYDRDGYLDGELIESENDSVVILYREGSWDEWHEIEQSRYGLWSFGEITVSDLQPGEYTLAVWDKQIVGTEEIPCQNRVTIYPNPSRGFLNFEFEERGSYSIVLYDEKGALLEKFTVNGKSKTWKWRDQKAFSGIVFVHVYKGEEQLTIKKLVFTK